MHASGLFRSRPPAPVFAAAVIALLASVVGVSLAAGFDENVEAPPACDAAELRARARSVAERDAQARSAGLASLIRDRDLARQRFDLSWNLQRAIDARLPLGDLSAQGLVDRGDGSYGVDLTANPQWSDPASDLAVLLPALDPVGVGIELTRRGMRPEALAAFREFQKTHDVKSAKESALLPLVMGFSRVVERHDRLGKPVPDALVLSFLYQRESAAADVERVWATGLLDTLGSDGTRILQSYLGEMRRSGIYAPTDPRAGIDGVLASLRPPK